MKDDTTDGDGGIASLHRHTPVNDVADAILDCENPRERLDEEHTSDDIYHMIPGGGRSKYTTKERRIEVLIHRVSDIKEDYRHFD